MRAARAVAARHRPPAPAPRASAGRQPPPQPAPPHAAVALDLEFAHYRVGGRVLRLPAEVAVVGEGGEDLFFSRVGVDYPPDAFVGGVPPSDTAGALPLTAVRDAVASLLAGGAAVVGHGVAADAASLGLPPLPRSRVRDTAHAISRERKGSTPSLATLAGELGGGEGPLRSDPAARHCARADARAAMRVYLATVRGTAADGPDPAGDEAARVVAEWESRARERGG